LGAKTTIKILKTTQEFLKEHGKKGESYDTIILRGFGVEKREA
jgi:hypothetical protein